MANPICLIRGTRVRTPSGERAIETMAIGDDIVALSGAIRPVKWIGRQRFRRAAGRTEWVGHVVPVRIAAGALGVNVPSSDLYVSQGHAVYLEGVLVAAGDLLTGDSIVLAAPDAGDTLDYFNIELESHDVILAAGTPVETFLPQDGTREQFDNFAEYERLYGRDDVRHESFAPRAGFNGGRSELKSRLRRALAPVLDRRTPLDKILDRVGA